MLNPWRTRGELVISMTIAETFLLLVFMLWYTIRPRVKEPPAPAAVVQAENDRLKKERDELRIKLADLDRRLRWWQERFDRPVPGSEAELKTILFEAGRGKPKCQENNVLLDISLINGRTTMNVLADAPALRATLQGKGVDFRPGATITVDAEVAAVLRHASAFRKGVGRDGECRFDYRFTYATFEDYYTGRERFEKYFYSAGRKRANLQ